MAQAAMTIEQALEKAKKFALEGKVGEAIALYQAVLKHQPRNVIAISRLKELSVNADNIAIDPPQHQLQPIVQLHGAKQFGQALQQAADLARHFPNSALLANVTGVLLRELGQKEQAINQLRRALEIKPDFIEVLANLGTLLNEMGKPRDALPYLEKAHAALPNATEILNSLANVQSALGDTDKALENYQKAIRVSPDEVISYCNLGNLLGRLGRLDEALAMLAEAIRLRPDFVDVHNNLGNILRSGLHFELAEEAFRRALSFQPDNVAAHANLGHVLGDMGRAPEALEHYRQVLEKEPDNLSIRALALYQQALTCFWDDEREQSLETLKITLEARSDGGNAPSPFAVMTLIDDAGLQKKAAFTYFDNICLDVPPRPAFPDPAPDGRIRIGYFSADFYGHATMCLIARLFELHDRSRFEIHAFSFGPDVKDDMQQRLLQGVEHFHNISSMSHEDAARFSRELGIEIAVDLKGYTRDSRAKIFAHRAAPIQVNYLGYPGTLGAEVWDYIIADRVLLPPGMEAGYSEKIVRLPGSYQINDDKRQISDRQFSRAECGLPEEGFVFACFNNSYKITPAEFDVWMRLLKQVEGSVLWLLAGVPGTENNLRREALARGVDPSRLVFAPRLQVPEHLARHRLADLFLDTFVVNAHTTASDALWAGLPVVSLAGKGFASRVSASLLHAVGLAELVTENMDDYEALALELAQNPERLAGFRQALMKNTASLPLFDTARYLRGLEQAYCEMFSHIKEGNWPRDITIQPV